MKIFLVFAGILLLALAACTPQAGPAQDNPASPQIGSDAEASVDAASGDDPSTPDPSTYLEASDGALTARIFSAPETTINQREFVLRGWTNRAGVVSANDIIITNAANETFSIELTLEDGPNLIEVIVSDRDGNEVMFELIVYVEE